MATYPIYQFYAELEDYCPKIWRRFQVANNISFARLGYILMTMFEMKASHLFCFDIPSEENFKREIKNRYSEKDIIKYFGDLNDSSNITKNYHIEIITEESYEYRDEKSERLIDAVDRRLKDFLYYPDERITFTYDFGDNWKLNIVLEKIIVDKKFPGRELPRVLEGQGYGIIEDCGGTSGLLDIAKAFKKKKGQQFKEYCDWLGVSDLDFLNFDIKDMNFRLKKVPRIYKDIYEFEIEPSKQSIDLLERKYKKP